MSARPLEVLVGVRAIARFLKVSNHAVLTMEKRGAPIVRNEKNSLRAEKNTLWAWYVRKKGGAKKRRVVMKGRTPSAASAAPAAKTGASAEVDCDFSQGMALSMRSGHISAPPRAFSSVETQC